MKAIQTGPIQVNTWIVNLAGNDVFIVDPAGSDATGDSKAITSYLVKQKLTPVAVLLTHGHFDHVIGLSAIKEAFPSIKIAIHKEDSDSIGSSNSEQFHRNSLEPMGATSLLPFLVNLPKPDFLLNDKQTLSSFFTKECISEILKTDDIQRAEQDEKAFAKWQVIHTPGHTKGSVCFFNKQDKMMISGDTVFFQSWGRTDLFGGSEVQMVQSLAKLKDSVPGDTIVFPGHDYSGFPLSATL